MASRRRFLARLGAAPLALAGLGARAQAGYPDKPVRLVVTFGPGSGPDTLARTIAPKIGEALGQSVYVDNRPAAGGNVAAQFVLGEKRDGYTLLLGTDSLFTMNPYLLPKTPYDLFSDFTLVAPLAEAPVFLVVTPALNVSTPRELAALVKANPGKYTYSAPTATPHHLLSERFTALNGLDWVRVSYRDPQQALTEMVAGMVPIGFSSYAQVASSVSAGRLRVLGVSTASRLDALPAVPALAESYPGLEEAGWFAVYAGTGTPAPVLEKLSAAIARARVAPDVLQRLEQFGMKPLAADNASFAARVRAEHQRRGELIRTRGIRND